MRRLTPVTLCVAVIVALAGCGGHTHTVTVNVTNTVTTSTQRSSTPGPLLTHPCNPLDYYMQCALPPAPQSYHVPLGQHVAAYGIDFGWGSPPPSAYGGFRFGASYLSYDPSKNWTLASVTALHAHGIATVVVWETSANRALSGFAGGYSDALAAAQQAKALRVPSTRPIFFAVDFDTTLYPSAITPYFQGVRAVLGARRCGAYGGLATIRQLFNSRLIAYGWQTYAWSTGPDGRTVWDTRAKLEQYSNDHVLAGRGVDYDRALAADYGQSPYTPPPPPPTRRPRCFGPHWDRHAHLCTIVRPQASRWSHARDSSKRAYAARACATHPHRADCRTFAQRARYFQARIHKVLY